MNTSKHSQPYSDGEYVIIQTYPVSKTLRSINRFFEYRAARDNCDIANMGDDYSCYGLRVYREGKLWTVDFDGKLNQISQEQFWQIDPIYQAASRDPNTDGEIQVHQCSYPYFSSLRTRLNRSGDASEYWQPVTCLVENSGNDIDDCPNCGKTLVVLEEYDDAVEDDDGPFSPPTTCDGCRNFHGYSYGKNAFFCGFHPSGWHDGDCPDFIAAPHL